MNSETPSTWIQTQQARANPSAVITADCRMHLQDQRNSRDVVLKSPGSAVLREVQARHDSPQDPAPALPVTRAA
jgi:hypothetical protein